MSESSPLVSVIIPIYNVEEYLPKCLQSVVEQSYEHIEVLCIVDGASDRSEDIARHFSQSDQRVKVLLQSNQGVSVARNVGVSASRGDYVFFLDSDDWLQSRAIEVLVAAALSSAKPVVSGAAIDFEEQTQEAKPYRKAKRRQLGNVDLRRQDLFSLEVMVWNKLYRRDVALAIPFEPNLIHEDIDFHWRAFTQFPEVFVIPDPIVYYRRRAGTLSNLTSYDELYQDNYIRVVDRAREVVIKYPDLRYRFEHEALKYLDYMHIKNAPHQRYKTHIEKKYGIKTTLLFYVMMNIRRYF